MSSRQQDLNKYQVIKIINNKYNLFESKSEAVSLGFNCNSAMVGVYMGIRTKKENGYKTCPFDEMVSTYQGIIECINDDFKYFCDSDYLEIIDRYDKLIYNSKYNFIFNHESPGHANLYIIQNWKNGINHYIMNDYEEFKIRYNKRIQNFRDLLNSGKHITFILTSEFKELSEISELESTIKNKYPLLKYSFLFLNC